MICEEPGAQQAVYEAFYGAVEPGMKVTHSYGRPSSRHKCIVADHLSVTPMKPVKAPKPIADKKPKKKREAYLKGMGRAPVTYQGVLMSRSDFAKMVGRTSVWVGLQLSSGRTPEDILNPVRTRRVAVDDNGNRVSLNAIAKDKGLQTAKLYVNYFDHGMTVQEAIAATPKSFKRRVS